MAPTYDEEATTLKESSALLFFLLFCVGAYLYIGASRSVVDLCPSAITTSHSGALPDLKPDSNPELTPECQKAITTMWVGVGVLLVLGTIGTIYAACRRTQIRKKFGIAGSFMGDCCMWFWCPTCALCQETRTLWHNNVTEGVWYGPAREVTAATLLVYGAPAVNSM